MTLAVLAVVVFLILANALFVATEFALVAGRRTRLEEAAKGGSRAAIRALRARKSLRLQMSGAQLGITASSIAVGILAESAIGGLLDVPLLRSEDLVLNLSVHRGQHVAHPGGDGLD